MKVLMFIWSTINKILAFPNSIFKNKIIQIIINYWLIVIFIGIVFFVIRLVAYSLYKVVKLILNRFKQIKNIIAIRWEVELQVYFERMYFKFKIYKIKGTTPDENKFRAAGVYSPLGISRFLKRILKRMISIDIYNTIVWFMVIMYTFKIEIDKLKNFVSRIVINNLIVFFEKTNINSAVELFKNISFLIVAILIITGYWSYLSIYRKISNDRLEKVLKYQESLITISARILYKLENNIDVLIKRRDNLPNFLSELITGTTIYNFENNSLTKLASMNSYRYIDSESNQLENQLYKFGSFTEEINKLKNIMSDIEAENLRSEFYKAYRDMNYEAIVLGLNYTNPLENIKGDLLDKENIKQWLLNLSNNGILKREYENMVKVWKGEITKSEYEQNYIHVNGLTFDDREKYQEKELERKLIECSENIEYRLRRAIRAYLILERYLEKLEKHKWRLEFFSKIK